MQKRLVTFDEIKSACIKFSANYLLGREDIHLVAVMRSGMIPTQIISFYLEDKSIRFFYLDRSEYNYKRQGNIVPAIWSSGVSFKPNNGLREVKRGDTLVFIDEIVARGETYRAVQKRMALEFGLEWMYVVLGVDSDFDDSSYPYLYTMMKPFTDWAIFPWQYEEREQIADWKLELEAKKQEAREDSV